MNKDLSIIELHAKRTLPRVLAVLAVMAAGEYFWARSMLLNDKVVQTQAGYSYTTVYSLGSLSYPFCLGYCLAIILIYAILVGRTAKKSAVGYRLDMLGVSGRRWMILNSVYDAGCYFLAWAVTAGMLLAAAELYKTLPKFAGGEQSIFLEIYRSGSLTYFLPEGFVSRLLIMLGITLGLGVLTATDARKAASGRFLAGDPIAAAAIILSFCFTGRLGLLSVTINWVAVVSAAVFSIALMRFISIMTEPSQKGVSQEADDGE